MTSRRTSKKTAAKAGRARPKRVPRRTGAPAETGAAQDPAFREAALQGELEAARRSGARLLRALDAVLPLVRSAMAGAKDGPESARFIPDPDAEGATILPEVLEAERALHACRDAFGRIDGAANAGFDQLPEEEFREDGLGALPESGDAAVDGAARLVRLFASIRARRISGLPVDGKLEDDLVRLRAALKAALVDA